MNNAPNISAILRALIVYAVCVPLAVFLGFTLTNPLEVSTFGFVGILLVALAFPLLLRWHHPLLLICWNTSIVLFFLKGQPGIWLAMVPMSLAISVLERTLNSRMRFITVPQITWPLLCIVAVVLVTAKFTGGFGLRSFGSKIYGGKEYIVLLIGIASYFALTAKKIPPKRVKLYIALFFLGGVTAAIGDLWPIAPSWTHAFLNFFPYSNYYNGEFELGTTRLAGTAQAGISIVSCLLAIYGVRGVFLSRKLWRLAAFMLAVVMVFLGGFRSELILVGMTVMVLFFMEGLHRTRLMPVCVLMGMLTAALVIPLARHLPFTFQRTLAFLPLDLDPATKLAAQDSLDWRLDMWQALLPQIPQHLLLGKGYAITLEDYEMMGQNVAFRAIDPSQQGLALADDYHNGPLSVILPFGIWGVIAFLWFLFAGWRVLLANYRNGNPALKVIATYLLAAYLVQIFMFFIIFGSLFSQMSTFIAYIGLSIAINGGVARPAAKPAAQSVKALNAGSFLRPPRPVLQR